MAREGPQRSGPDPVAAVERCGQIGELGTTEVVIVEAPVRVSEESTSQQPAPTMRRLNPRESLAKQFRGLMRGVGRDIAERAVVDYDPGRTPDAGEVAWVPLARYPILLAIRRELDQSLRLDLYQPNRGWESKPEISFVSVFENGHLPVHFANGLGGQFRLSTSKRIAAVLGGEAYDRLDEEVLLFDAAADAILLGDVVIIVNQSAFEKIFGFLEQLRRTSDRVFTQVTRHLRIRGIDQFRLAATTNLQMMRKLRSVGARLQSNPRYRQAMTMSRLLAFIDRNPHIQIGLEGKGSRRELVFQPSAQHRWRILKLIDDDYLKSNLTDLDYEANSKSAMS